jgi:hypothetical protein
MGIDGQRHASASLTPGKRPGTHFTGGWLGPMDGLEACGKSRSNRYWIIGPYCPQRVSKPTTLFRPTSRADITYFFWRF